MKIVLLRMLRDASDQIDILNGLYPQKDIMKIDKSKWTGEQLFDYYFNLGGDYEQTLSTARMTIGDGLFPLLEQCERENKIIDLVDGDSGNVDPEINVVLISKPQ